MSKVSLDDLPAKLGEAIGGCGHPKKSAGVLAPWRLTEITSRRFSQVPEAICSG
jgi:hypothetical protein